jgi:hypothetical protein
MHALLVICLVVPYVKIALCSHMRCQPPIERHICLGEWPRHVLTCCVGLVLPLCCLRRSDTTGHLCGILAGLLRVYLPRFWPEIGAVLGDSRRIVSGGVVQGSRAWQGGGGRLGRCVFPASHQLTLLTTSLARLACQLQLFSA